MAEPSPGDVFEVDYPFVRCEVTMLDADGPYEAKSWRPGTLNRLIPPDDCESYANGVGKMILTVESVHKPGRFPTRVFYTRKFRGPDGRVFGKGGLHIATLQKFGRISRRFSYDYVIDPDETQGQRAA